MNGSGIGCVCVEAREPKTPNPSPGPQSPAPRPQTPERAPSPSPNVSKPVRLLVLLEHDDALGDVVRDLAGRADVDNHGAGFWGVFVVDGVRVAGFWFHGGLGRFGVDGRGRGRGQASWRWKGFGFGARAGRASNRCAGVEGRRPPLQSASKHTLPPHRRRYLRARRSTAGGMVAENMYLTRGGWGSRNLKAFILHACWECTW